ncbi:uncharacterized protein LOC111302549 [Durio zibethinus]|uniref:Uncharacterized protein LOC111302549 n=1 Tax=Durio zibethinus TaxID=66656 RepID=A0A6P5ZMU6_DURZI|nr:uncharacterized protein LOC111302549 [Durio zibethinus]
MPFFRKKEMDGAQTVVCVKRVKQDEPEEWDESMPLPGDIIEGYAENDADDELFRPAKVRSELSSQLGKIGQKVETIWVKVRRGDETHKLRVRVVAQKSSILQRKYTIRAARDDRHVAVLGDLTLERCTTLQEISRRLVNVEFRGFNRKEVKYDWKRKVGTHLPDQASTVVSSILFLPFQGEYCIEAYCGSIFRGSSCLCQCPNRTDRDLGSFLSILTCMNVFLISQEEKITPTIKEINRGKQQNHTSNVELVQSIRLWFLPGVDEVLLEMIPETGDAGFGMDIKRTEEGFICVYSVTKGSAADRAGLKQLLEEANAKKHLLVISRLEGKSLMPTSVSSAGLIYCCDHNEIRVTLISAINRMDIIQLHIMAWPNQTRPDTLKSISAATLRPPNGYYHSPPL